MKKIAVIGSGFFGSLTAFFLSKKYKIDLYEKQNKLFQGASKYNQMRYHLGFHYPRSEKTVNELKLYEKHFKSFFSNQGIFGKTFNYYGIAKNNSKTNYKNYINFLKKNKLKFKKFRSKDFTQNVQGSIVTNEKILNYFKAKKKILKILKNKNINILKNKVLKKDNINDYFKIIICAYDQNNYVLKKIGIKPKKKYRYELVEKILIKLPKRYRNKSYIILDGKFVCVDPFLNTNYHLLSDNKNSKIEISRGFFPKFKNIKKKYLTKGFLKNKKNSNFHKFIKNGSKYLSFLNHAKFVSTVFVIRTLELKKEKTDQRTNYVNFANEKVITVLSGKWNTSVGVAKEIFKKINEK
tara:strand:- start:344 stop:1399 length:1056 start_codon:yes stop_codon:yes gene_type:complete